MKRTSVRMVNHLLWIIVLVMSSVPIIHAEKVWTNTVSGLWQDKANWLNLSLPEISSFIKITNDLTKTVTLNALTPGSNLVAQMLTLSAPPGATNTVLLTDVGVTNPLTFQFGLDLQDGADLHLTNSALLLQLTNDHVNIDGTMTLDSGWINFGDTTVTSRVGRVTSGFLTLNSGTIWAGTVTVGGLTNSMGAINQNGGLLSISSLLSIAKNPGTTGTVFIAGGQLTVTNDDTRIGDSGFGQMTISNAQVTVSNVNVGHDPLSVGSLTVQNGALVQLLDDMEIAKLGGSTGAVMVTGGQLLANGMKIFVGQGGNGHLNASGGAIQAAMVLVAADSTNSSGATGSLTMSGGSLTIATNFFVGSASYSTGQVAVTGGTINVDNAGLNAVLAVPSGTFTLSGGTVTTDLLLLTNAAGQLTFNGGTIDSRGTTVANGAPFVIGDGVTPSTYHMSGGTHSFANTLVLKPNATLSGCGTIVGTIVNLGGTIATNCSVSLVRPAISKVIKTGTTATIFFTSTSGQNYTLQFKDTLTNTTWTSVSPSTNGNGGVETLQDTTASGPKRFYRLLAQ